MHAVTRQGMKGLYSILHDTARLMAASAESPGQDYQALDLPRAAM
jgi:hypothetical protein